MISAFLFILYFLHSAISTHSSGFVVGLGVCTCLVDLPAIMQYCLKGFIYQSRSCPPPPGRPGALGSEPSAFAAVARSGWCS